MRIRIPNTACFHGDILFCSAPFPRAPRLLSARQRGTVPLPLTRTPGQSREETSQEKGEKLGNISAMILCTDDPFYIPGPVALLL
jgi:hypothetical protein